MKRPLAACRYVCGSLAAITAVTSALPVTAAANTSSANFDMRRQVVNLTGILNVTDYTGQVTRGDFARMLVNASSYRENLPSSSVSVFADVPGTHPDAVYIRIAASQGWMTGFLGGLFKPEEYITYKDAVKAALTMLGYSDEDFTGDLASSRISKFNYLELNEEMNRQPEAENANVFLNGTASTLEAVKASQQDAGFAVVYYNVKSKTIWAYTTRGWDDDELEGNNAYVLLKGEVKNIYYKSTDVMTPTSIRLEIDDDNSDGDFGEDGIDEDGYLTINLNSSELQYLFSIYGGIEVGDEVVMVCNKSGSSYTAVDAIEY